MDVTPIFPPAVQAVLGEIYSIATPEQGATSQVWLVECAAGSCVVKHATRAPFVDWLLRDGLVLRALEATGLPVPKLVFDGGALAEPLPYTVMNRLLGEPLSSVMETTTDAERRLHLMKQFGMILRRIHDTPAPHAVRHEIAWLDERLNTAEAYIQTGYDLDADDPPALLAKLKRDKPLDVRQRLIHGDFMWNNVLVQGDQISGVVDWAGGTYGDPRYDLALAICPKDDGELSEAEVAAFYAGYGGEPLSQTEYQYFNDLYNFF